MTARYIELEVDKRNEIWDFPVRIAICPWNNAGLEKIPRW